MVYGTLPKKAKKETGCGEMYQKTCLFSELDPILNDRLLPFCLTKRHHWTKIVKSLLLFCLIPSQHPKLSFRYHLPGCFAFAQIGKADGLKEIWSTCQFRWEWSRWSNCNHQMIKLWSSDRQITIIKWLWEKFAIKRSLTRRQGRICRETAREEPEKFLF